MSKLAVINIGSDPEFFIKQTDTDECIYVASTIIAEGTKEEPKSIGNGFFVQRDNLALEGNIPPAKTKEEFIKFMKHLKSYFNKKLEDFGAELAYVGEADFPDYIAESPEGLEFGCSNIYYSWHNIYFPSENILDIKSVPTPRLEDSNTRTAGFHIHIGYEMIDNEYNFTKSMVDTIIAKLFDLFVIIPSLSVVKEPYRMSTYGLLGNYRSKNYGIECRALSAKMSDDIYLSWVWDRVIEIIDFYNNCTEAQLRHLLELYTYNDPTVEVVEELLFTFIPNEYYSIIKENTDKLNNEIKNYAKVYQESV